jgi:CheY-like chemotaxis protein
VSHTLLLADDSVTIQRVIELTFAEEDVHVIAVSDGDQAIARLEAAPPDIVLADIGMPGKNGYEVAQFVKQTPRLAHIPVVLLTGAFEPVDQDKAAAAGCDGVLAKPFEPQMVIGRVKELLARGGSTAPVPTPPAAPPLAIVPSPVAPPAAPSAIAPPPAKKPVLDDVEKYFDRLDAAFATLNKEAPPRHEPEPPPASGGSGLEWISAPPIQPPPAEPLSYASELSAFDRASSIPDPAEHAPDHPPAAPVHAPGHRPSPPLQTAQVAAAPQEAAVAGLPSIVDAFAAILAAEQRGPASTTAMPWPASAPPAPVTDVTDDLVERVARRVLEQLSDRVVRDTVAERVSAIAERLVREEIERIKSTIK